MSSGVGVLLLLLATGCESKRFEECEDTTCRTKTVNAAFTAEPNRVLDYLAATKDPVEQAALVELLVHDFPQASGNICAVVASGSIASQRCEKLKLRPHLYSAGVTAPLRNRHQVPELAAPWPRPDIDEVRADCAAADLACLGDLALERADRGALVEAGQLCTLAWPEGSSSRDECMFQAAEKVAMAKGSEATAAVVATCAQAGSFAGNCLQHTLVLLQPVPPPADAPDAESVAAMKRHMDALGDVLEGKDGEHLVHYAWAVWTRDAFQQATSVNGALLDALPADAAPHVRAAAAMRLTEISPTTSPDMDIAAATLKAWLDMRPALAAKPTTASTIKPADRLTAPPIRQSWVIDSTEAEAELEAISCMGAGRRTVGLNEVDDLRIATLEAAARRPVAAEPNFFLSVIGTNQTERVRWTAARLAAELYPRNAAEVASRDSSALVRDALAGVRDRPALATSP